MLIITISYQTSAQISSIHIWVDGLTCSQCSRSVEMQLRNLSFVKEVQMDLEEPGGVIFFKDKNAVIYFDAIAKAVKDAGFSLRAIDLSLPASVKSGECYSSNNQYFFISQKAVGDIYRITEKRLMSATAWRRVQPLNQARCRPAALYLTPAEKVHPVTHPLD